MLFKSIFNSFYVSSTKCMHNDHLPLHRHKTSIIIMNLMTQDMSWSVPSFYRPSARRSVAHLHSSITKYHQLAPSSVVGLQVGTQIRFPTIRFCDIMLTSN